MANPMTVQEFKSYLAESGVDSNSDSYDDLWSGYLFGGKSPNQVYDKVNALYNAGKIEMQPVAPSEISPSEWELRGSETGE